MIKVLKPGLATSVQDLGREGYYHLGIPPSGALDQYALSAANHLVGNPAGAAGLECALVGPELEFRQDALVAVCGAQMPALLDGREQRPGVLRVVLAADYQRLEFLGMGLADERRRHEGHGGQHGGLDEETAAGGIHVVHGQVPWLRRYSDGWQRLYPHRVKSALMQVKPTRRAASARLWPMENLPYDPARLAQRAAEIVANTRELSALGWTPATSSNFSMRLDDRHAAITVSGRDKGRLGPDDIMVVDFEGRPVATSHRPSAETLLHTQLYARYPEIGCVLHTHSHVQTVASRLYASQGHVHLEGYELLKAFHGNHTHEMAIDVPVLANTQDMDELAGWVETLLDQQPMWGYLINGHGLYAWGKDMAEARRHLEAFEFLLSCELDLRRLQA